MGNITYNGIWAKDSLTLEIQGWHPATLNSLIHCHWTKAQRTKDGDKVVIGAVVKGLPKAEIKRRVNLKIGLGYRQRSCDPDAYWKSLLDALTHTGMLKDDSPQWAELAPVEYYRTKSKQPETIITLMDMA